jgi:hypothetical protein
VYLIFANIFVGAKHFGIKSLTLTNKLPAEMLRPCTHRDAPDLGNHFYSNPSIKNNVNPSYKTGSYSGL